jgi:small subunit ribosomal protein S17
MKLMQGTVQSAKTPQTAIVSVVNRWQHPLYKKFVKNTKNYACHVVDLKVVEGDTVIIQECRPISKTKKFKVIKKVEKAEVVAVKEIAKKVTK